MNQPTSTTTLYPTKYSLPAPGTATEATQRANRSLAELLPISDSKDFEDARRGLIACLENPAIRDKKGRAVLDVAAFDFLGGPAPNTVNPSLWRQAKLNAIHGLFEVADGVYQVRGYDISVMTVIRGEKGWIVVDPLLTEETARAAFALVEEHLGARPITAVLITHTHSDHFGGIRGIVSERQVRSGATRIIAPEGFVEYAVRDLVLAGNCMARRAMYQFGLLLPRSAAGLVDAGIGKEAARGTRSFMEPTELISQTGQKVAIDGVEFVFQMVSGSEAPAEFTFYLPGARALCMSEVACRTMHNILTLRGAHVRDPLLWAHYIDEAIALFGDEVEVVFACHNWPEWGNDNANRYLREQRDIYKYIHDQTLRLANAGYTPIEIAERVVEPGFLKRSFSARGYYGTLNHNVKATYQKYYGYFDGNPANLDPLEPAEAAKRYVEAMGGSVAVLDKAWRSFEKGDYRWVATLLGHLVFAAPDNSDARLMLASTYEQLGFQAESTIWRNIYLTGALELREGVTPVGVGVGELNPDIVKAMGVEELFELFAARLDPARAAGTRLLVDFQITDLDETVRVTLENGVTNHSRGKTYSESADATIWLARADLVAFATGRLGADDAAGENLVIEGDASAFPRFLEMHDSFDLWFNIVTP